jgi:hypothetical protein
MKCIASGRNKIQYEREYKNMHYIKEKNNYQKMFRKKE